MIPVAVKLKTALAAGAVARKWLRQQHGVQVRGCMTQLGALPIAVDDWSQTAHNPFFAATAQGLDAAA